MLIASHIRSVSCWCAILLFASGSAAANAQWRQAQIPDSLLVAASDYAVDKTIPAGEIVGVVVDAYKGTPLAQAGAWVFLSEGHAISTTTDSAGHFRLTGVPLQPVRVQARLFGFRDTGVDVDARSGAAVRLGLAAHRMTIECVDAVGAVPAVMVVVRDSRTSLAPNAAVTLMVRDGDFTERKTAKAPDSAATPYAIVGAADHRDGKYDVEVSANGYRIWTATGLRPEITRCNSFLGRVLNIWLLPLKSSSSGAIWFYSKRRSRTSPFGSIGSGSGSRASDRSLVKSSQPLARIAMTTRLWARRTTACSI